MYNTKIYRCLKCGWEKETDEHELECPICHSKNVRVEENEEYDNKIADNLEKENPEADMVDILKRSAIDNIKEGFKKFGIERTEDKINEVYENIPEMKEYLLKIYKEIITGVIK